MVWWWPEQMDETSNHCELLMVLLHDGMFNKYIQRIQIYAPLAILCLDLFFTHNLINFKFFILVTDEPFFQTQEWNLESW